MKKETYMWIAIAILFVCVGSLITMQVSQCYRKSACKMGSYRSYKSSCCASKGVSGHSHKMQEGRACQYSSESTTEK